MVRETHFGDQKSLAFGVDRMLTKCQQLCSGSGVAKDMYFSNTKDRTLPEQQPLQEVKVDDEQGFEPAYASDELGSDYEPDSKEQADDKQRVESTYGTDESGSVFANDRKAQPPKNLRKRKNTANVRKRTAYCLEFLFRCLLILPVVCGNHAPGPGGLCDFVGPLDQIVEEGESALLTCRTCGDTPVKWSKDGTDIYTGYDFRLQFQHRYSIIKDSPGQYDLVINKTDEEAKGNYTCLEPGTLKNKTARLVLGSGRTKGPHKENILTVTNIQRYSDFRTSVSGTDENRNASTNPTVPIAVVSVVFAAVVIAIVGMLIYRSINKRAESGKEKQLKPMLP